MKLLQQITSLSEGKMKDAMVDLIEKAAKLVDEPEDSSKYSMLVTAKVLELDTDNLFRGNAVDAEEMVKGTLGLSEGSVTQLKKMHDPASGKDVMVNMDKAKPISMLAAFGGEALQVLHDMGLKTLEKPDWSDLDRENGVYRPWKELDVRRAEKTLGQKFPRVEAKEIFGSNHKSRSPLGNFSKKPAWDHGIVKFSDGTSYFIDTTQANTYARMWAKVE